MKSANAINPVSNPISAAVLLLVEGQDEEYLVQKMCEHWFGPRALDIDIECVGGGDNFPKRFKALTVRSLGALKVVGVIADSEEDPAATAQRWSDLFADVAPKINRPCKKLQLPCDETPGAFEALVLNASDDDAVVSCAINFRDCVSPHLGDRTLAQKDKIAVQAWLSAKLGSAYGNVFKAQEKNPTHQLLNYDHAAFAPIKTFIKDLLAEASQLLKEHHV
jgi:hypothetical protein